jgi:hypothetical protein
VFITGQEVGKNKIKPMSVIQEQVYTQSDSWENVFMNQKHAILTISIGNNRKSISKYTKPLVAKYCEKYSLDHIFIEHNHQDIANNNVRFNKPLFLYDYIHGYDRIILMDDTCLINPECENLFDLIPKKTIGALLESSYFDRIQAIKDIANIFNEKKYKDWVMINSGVLIVDKSHVEFLKFTNKRINNMINFNGTYMDQSLISYSINKLKLKITDIGEKYNFVGSRLYNVDINNKKEFKKICLENKILHATRGLKEKRLPYIEKIYSVYT